MKNLIKSSILLYSFYLFLLPLLSVLSIVLPNPVYAQTPTRIIIPTITPINPTPTSPSPLPQVRFLYDGDGNRVAKIENGKTTFYFGDYEKDKQSGEITKYYTSGSKKVAFKKSNSLAYIIPDHHGSLSKITDQMGNVTASEKYYPYGQSRTNTLTIGRGYIGNQKDLTSNLYLFGSRFYNPQTGKFITADSVQDFQNFNNRYGYAANNPITYTDAEGHIIPFLIGAAIVGMKIATVLLATAIVTKVAADVTEKVIAPNVFEPGSNNYNTAMNTAETLNSVSDVTGGAGVALGTVAMGGAFILQGAQAVQATIQTRQANQVFSRESPSADMNPSGKPNFMGKVDEIVAKVHKMGIDPSVANATSQVTSRMLKYDKRYLYASMEDACAAGRGVCYHYAGLANSALRKMGVASFPLQVPSGANGYHALVQYNSSDVPSRWESYIDPTYAVRTFYNLGQYLDDALSNNLYPRGEGAQIYNVSIH
jgi:RHS repeat-associated protein